MDVNVYSTPTCGYCHQAKKYLNDKQVKFTEYDVSVNQAAAQEIMKLTGQMGVPVITIDGQVIIGFDRARLENMLAKSGNGQRPRLGLKVTDVKNKAPETDAGPASGAFVVNTKRASLAEKAGLTQGDIITEVNSKPINSAEDLEKALANLTYGSRVKVIYLRQQETLQAEILA